MARTEIHGHRSSSSSKKVKKSKKTKKKRKRQESSSSSSYLSDSSAELLIKLEVERQRNKEYRKREKEKMKENETLEEKRLRRLRKKENKHHKHSFESGSSLYYTNDDNPFGDSNLTSKFRWTKKLKDEGLDGLMESELIKIQRREEIETIKELEKVKKARLEREKEREERLALLELEERSRENEKFEQWRQDEDEFHLKQAKLRSQVRIKDGRAKPIDLLAKYISSKEEEVDGIEMHEPYALLHGLSASDYEDLIVDIKVYSGIDVEDNKDFWKDIHVIVEDELHKLKKCEDGRNDRRQGVNKSVAEDVALIFSDKNAEELSSLQVCIERKLVGGEGIDIGYWESLLSQLKAHLAKARLRDKHSENLKKKLELLRKEQRKVKEETKENRKYEKNVEDEKDDEKNEDGNRTQNISRSTSGVSLKVIEEREDVDDYKRNSYTPPLLFHSELPEGAVILNEEEDAHFRLGEQQRAGRNCVDVYCSLGPSEEELACEREAKKGMTEDESVFAVESILEESYDWSDKYRPRKPRYFNRVHTGFEWNKYNQTHYDIDNPPPKIVQGYKFNIFYPDLIDKNSTPSYTLSSCKDNPEFCILRIHAGPPYEDIAFKIVNREWEYGYKRGFKCQFHNNIFQMWFHFKRLRYRR